MTSMATGEPEVSSAWAKGELMKDWDDPEMVAGWSRWHDQWSEHTAALTDAIVETLSLPGRVRDSSTSPAGRASRR
jgi:hypothetical protein